MTVFSGKKTDVFIMKHGRYNVEAIHSGKHILETEENGKACDHSVRGLIKEKNIQKKK